jgi:drug/metabolite transporter (DMT)-like permease
MSGFVVAVATSLLWSGYVSSKRRLITNMDGIFIVYISYVPPSSLLLLLILLYYGPVMFKPNTFQHLEPKSGCFGLSL